MCILWVSGGLVVSGRLMCLSIAIVCPLCSSLLIRLDGKGWNTIRLIMLMWTLCAVCRRLVIVLVAGTMSFRLSSRQLVLLAWQFTVCWQWCLASAVHLLKVWLVSGVMRLKKNGCRVVMSRTHVLRPRMMLVTIGPLMLYSCGICGCALLNSSCRVGAG